MGAKSRRKGKVGERELAKELIRLFGCQARRGQQFSGSNESPDVVCDIPGLHWEVKRTERLVLWDAMEQAVGDAGQAAPIVCHRPNGRPWLAIVRLDDLPEVVTRLYLQLMAKHS